MPQPITERDALIIRLADNLQDAIDRESAIPRYELHNLIMAQSLIADAEKALRFALNTP